MFYYGCLFVCFNYLLNYFKEYKYSLETVKRKVKECFSSPRVKYSYRRQKCEGGIVVNLVTPGKTPMEAFLPTVCYKEKVLENWQEVQGIFFFFFLTHL